jgi:serine/threonine protein kinase
MENNSNRLAWEQVSPEPIGGGGQSLVYKVRTPKRTIQRGNSLAAINSYEPISTQEIATKKMRKRQYVDALREFIREDLPEELGALKEFLLRDNPEQSLQRLKQEIAILEQGRPGLPRLLGFNANERWMVTEFFTNGTLEDHIQEYRGKAGLALKAFRSVVATVAELHKENIVHRDIKPANIFVGEEHELILGDFGLVYVPNNGRTRITKLAGETVGAGDFIPPVTWRGTGTRPEVVTPNFDVYMLGKVLWCMVAGRPKLEREFWDYPEYDLTKLFPGDPDMHMINVILKNSVVIKQSDCLSSAINLLTIVDSNLETLKRGGQLLLAGIPRICRICGVGHYARQDFLKDTPNYNLRLWNSGGANDISTVGIEFWECGTCHHVELFRTNPRQ